MTTCSEQRWAVLAPDTSCMTLMNAAPAATEHPVAPEDALVMGLLHRHIPIALLCDLTAPEGPQSAEILAEEGLPETAWWER